MKVIIPVAGEGKRLRPHTLTKPKVMIDVAGFPMIYHIIKQVIQERVAKEIIIITGKFGDLIKKYITYEFKFNFKFVEQKVTLGLGHAIYCARDFFKENKNQDLLIILGDTLFEVNIKKFCSSRNSVIGTKLVDDPSRFGVVEKYKNGFIKKFVEKPSSMEITKSKEAIVGLYYIKNSNLLFNSIEYIIKNNYKNKGEFQLTDALEIMIKNNNRMKTFRVDGWLDCGKPETLLETNKHILEKNNKKIKIENNKIINPVYISKDVKLFKNIIGPNTSISKKCFIRNSLIENSIISEGCHIENSIIRNSIIGSYCRIFNINSILNIGDYSDIII